MIIPIYKDTYYTTSASTLEYSIAVHSGATLFSGKAYKYPDANDLSIKINDICSYSLDSDLPSTIWSSNSGTLTLPNAVKKFDLLDDEDNILEQYEFSNDWSYGDDINIASPITGKRVAGMYALKSTLESSAITVNFKKSSGNGYTIEGCGDWAIYYCNLKSGWDSLLIEGKVEEKKNIEHFDYSKIIDNNVKGLRENNRMQSNVELNWELNTGWLTDSQSEILFNNLLSSNYVYLHKISENKIYPVHIVDSSVTKKKFKNEKQLISYKINVTSDNKRYVR